MSSNKPWERPWSMDEIIENSDNWNLAGDVALLNTLKAFADNLLSKTSEINNNLHNITSSLDETSLQLNIARNQFQSLRNTQFIESRVYEDDESLPVNEPDDKKPKVDTNEEHTEDIRLATMKGLEVMNEFFEKVEVSVSDSEDEDIDLPNYVLRPKDLYIDRPLPYVIGTEEWHKNWHVGLEDSSSDSETEKVEDSFSESSDSELPIVQDRSQIKAGTSDTSSELDFGPKVPVDKNNRNEFFNSSDSENSAPVQAPISNKNFAEQLAARLGHVITQETEEAEVNRRPIQQPKSNYGDIFFDEPPPLDEPKGPFSGRHNLFDDDDIEGTKSGGLFDNEGSSDEEMFAPQKVAKKPLFNEEPPVLGDKKKPIGGVSILGGGKIFDKKLLRRQTSSSDEQEEEKKKIDLFGDDHIFTRGAPPKTDEVQKIPKKINLFDSDDEDKDGGLFGASNKPNLDEEAAIETKEEKPSKKINIFDDDDLFKDDLFSTNTKKKFTSGLFDDVPNDDLFTPEETKKPNLFDDLMATPDTKNSINNDLSKSDVTSGESEPPKPKPRLALFDSTNQPRPSLFDSPPSVSEAPPPDEKLFDSPPPESSRDDVVKPRLSLFDSPPPEPDDLFGDSTSPPIKKEFQASATPTFSLFDASPPPDDDWSTKSDSDREDLVGESGGDCFEEEPPCLEPEPEVKIESPAVKKPGKLKHNLNINVGALIPGSAPPKRGEVEKLPSDVIDKGRDVRVTFEETEGVGVLHSVTKDRARVPLNRRPSTRRGRKAALERSDSDFKLEKEEVVKKNEETEKESTGVKSEEKSKQEPKSSRLFEDEETEDIFNSSSLSIAEAKPKPSLFEETEPQDSLFDSSEKKKSIFEDEAESEDIFKTSTKSSSGLFDGEEEDDLFSNKKAVLPTKAKKSLFDDDDDDDDIFKDFTSTTAKKTESKVASEKKIAKVGSSVKKLENTKSEDDPLSALLK